MSNQRQTDPLVGQHAIEIVCTGCRHSVATTIEQIRDKQHMPCPNCEHPIVLGTSHINAQIRSIVRSLSRLRNQLAQSGTFGSAGLNWKTAPRRRRKT
jgi:hypothetical protein